MAKWLLLTHQLPAEPANARVKIWRKLQDLGAVPIKNSIYVLPNRTGTREDFEWLKKEITAMKGEASVFLADSITDMDEKEIIRTFQEARAKEYARFIHETTTLLEHSRNALQAGHVDEEHLARLEKDWTVLKMQWERLKRIDFFNSSSQTPAKRLVAAVHKVFEAAGALSNQRRPASLPLVSSKTLIGRRWVTRISPHIDRLACAWLVRRFIDAEARFKFVKEPYRCKGQEVCFDMAEGEFTHFGDWCSFETFIHRLSLTDPALKEMSEVIHDIDLKDKKFGRLEASGLSQIVRGLCRVYKVDMPRVEAAMPIFEALYASFESHGKS
jgi:hypothetical protein